MNNFTSATPLPSTNNGAPSLIFQSTEFEILDRDGRPWLRGLQIGSALGYADEKAINRIYARHASEFTPGMTGTVKLTDPQGDLQGQFDPAGQTVNLTVQGQMRETRIFSLRGAHLLAMFARTAIAALFRKWVLDILDNQTQTTRPMLVSNTITPAQAQHLRELVDLVVASGKQGYPDTWSRLHRKMHVNSYLMLRPDQFDAACQYLQGKFDDTSMAALIQKHFPGNALTAAAPDTDRVASAFMAAQSVSDQVQKAVFNAVLAGGDDWKHQRFMTSFITDSAKASPPVVERLLPDEFITSASQLPNLLLKGEGVFTTRQISDIAGHASLRMLTEVCQIELSSEVAQIKKRIHTLHTGDLTDLIKKAYVGLSLRGTMQDHAALCS